jgi:hypothetical protein
MSDKGTHVLIVVVSLLCLFYYINRQGNKIEQLERQNSELEILKDSTISVVVNALAFADSMEAENMRIQANKDSLQVYYNIVEQKLIKKERDYEKLVRDTSDIYKLYRELTEYLFTY